MITSNNKASSSPYEKDPIMSFIPHLSARIVEEDSANSSEESKLMASISDLTLDFAESSVSELTSTTSETSPFSENSVNSKLMESLSDLSAVIVDGHSNTKECLSNLVSSFRSIVDMDSSLDDLQDSWQDSFKSDAGEDQDEDQDFNGSIKNLFAAVNDLLQSRVTFTLHEGSSLDTERTRLKEMKARKFKIFEPKRDSFFLDIPASGSVAVEKQKARLRDTLRAALGAKELATRTPAATKPLNPSRFDASGVGDPALMIRIVRHEAQSSNGSRIQEVCRASLNDSNLWQEVSRPSPTADRAPKMPCRTKGA